MEIIEPLRLANYRYPPSKKTILLNHVHIYSMSLCNNNPSSHLTQNHPPHSPPNHAQRIVRPWSRLRVHFLQAALRVLRCGCTDRARGDALLDDGADDGGREFGVALGCQDLDWREGGVCVWDCVWH